MYYSLICKFIKSAKFKNQRTLVVLNKPDEKFPTFINLHKNYTDACELEPGNIYAVDLFKDPKLRNGYTNWKICKSTALSQSALA
jgi:hypothetical protein